MKVYEVTDSAGTNCWQHEQCPKWCKSKDCHKIDKAEATGDADRCLALERIWVNSNE